MNMKKLANYFAHGEVNAVHIDACGAQINVKSTAKAELCIQYSKSFRPTLAESEGTLEIRQNKVLFARTRRPEITVFVPESMVPDVNISLAKGGVAIDGGFFGDVTVAGKMLKVSVKHATFENLYVKADELDISAEGITVKNLANALAKGGRVEIDKTFCKKAECRIKKGNIGLCNSACDFAVLNSEDGNIAASMLGCENDYTIELEGAAVSGKDNLSASGKSIRARAARGSVVLDFAEAPLYDEAFENSFGEEEVSA